jgi:hypothetical protein
MSLTGVGELQRKLPRKVAWMNANTFPVTFLLEAHGWVM